MAGVFKNKICRNKKHSPFYPTKHQETVLSYFPTSKFKGLLLFHRLGSGKTCTSILVADDMINKKLIRKVFVLSPGSLRKNWLDEYCKTCGLDSEQLEKYFTFITYNFNIIERLEKEDFNDSLVIIDECHNLINGVKNKSKNSLMIYEKILSSNCRVLALSGTPILHKVDEEWYLLGNMLKPGTFEPFTEPTDQQLKGIVSYYPGDKDFYPTVYYKNPIKMYMAPQQETEYLKMYKNENAWIAKPPDEKLKKQDPEKYENLRIRYIMATKRIFSRRISNAYYPKEISEIPDTLKNDGGWVSKKILKNSKLFKEISPKIFALILNIANEISTKHFVYSFFKTKSGVELIHSILTILGINSEIFSGDLKDSQRANLLKRFNDKNNRDGKYITVLLATGAGAEGISVSEVNNVHILESSTRENKTSQAIGRTIRYKSHYDMPINRQYVNVWRYWSETSSQQKMAIDEILYIMGIEYNKDREFFMEKVIENSIEALKNEKKIIF